MQLSRKKRYQYVPTANIKRIDGTVTTVSAILYGNSYAFSIVDSATNASTPKLDSSKPTVSVSGGPNPTAVFATTFPASASSALGTYVIGTGVVGMAGLAVVSMMGGDWAML